MTRRPFFPHGERGTVDLVSQGAQVLGVGNAQDEFDALRNLAHANFGLSESNATERMDQPDFEGLHCLLSLVGVQHAPTHMRAPRIMRIELPFVSLR
jgi:hypothetical protein